MSDPGFIQNMEAAEEMGVKLWELADDQSQWSQATFGTDSECGPVGPLNHLRNECDEAIAKPTDLAEYADLLILLLDASRRAGFSPLQVIEAAQEKMIINKDRKWPERHQAWKVHQVWTPDHVDKWWVVQYIRDDGKAFVEGCGRTEEQALEHAKQQAKDIEDNGAIEHVRN